MDAYGEVPLSKTWDEYLARTYHITNNHQLQVVWGFITSQCCPYMYMCIYMYSVNYKYIHIMGVEVIEVITPMKVFYKNTSLFVNGRYVAGTQVESQL